MFFAFALFIHALSWKKHFSIPCPLPELAYFAADLTQIVLSFGTLIKYAIAGAELVSNSKWFLDYNVKTVWHLNLTDMIISLFETN